MNIFRLVNSLLFNIVNNYFLNRFIWLHTSQISKTGTSPSDAIYNHTWDTIFFGRGLPPIQGNVCISLFKCKYAYIHRNLCMQLHRHLYNLTIKWKLQNKDLQQTSVSNFGLWSQELHFCLSWKLGKENSLKFLKNSTENNCLVNGIIECTHTKLVLPSLFLLVEYVNTLKFSKWIIVIIKCLC